MGIIIPLQNSTISMLYLIYRMKIKFRWTEIWDLGELKLGFHGLVLVAVCVLVQRNQTLLSSSGHL